MLHFFKNSPDKDKPRITTQLDFVRRTIGKLTKDVIQYWNHMNWVVRNDHILVGLIYQINSMMTNPYDIYLDVRNYQRDHNISSRGIVSNIHYGRVQPKSHFYGNACQEVIVEQAFDDAMYQILNKHYTQWEAVRVIHHPFTSFDFQLANGKLRQSEESGLCLIKFDIGLLYAQYIMWRKDKYRSENIDGVKKTIHNFVHSYVIPNMLYSHLECAWFNRYINLAMAKPVSNEKPDNRIGMMSPYTHLDETLRKIDDLLSKGRDDYHSWCCQVPGLFGTHLKQWLIQDSILETQQIRLSWLLGRLPYIEWLVAMDVELGGGANKAYRADILREHRRYKSGRLYDTIRYLNADEISTRIENNIVNLVEVL